MEYKLKYIVYDLETMPNIFTFCGYDLHTSQWYLYEISDRRNDRAELVKFLEYLKQNDYYMVGYNNLGFDYRFIHELLREPNSFTYQYASALCQQIISTPREDQINIWQSDRHINQIDLYKINHFDNKSRSTSLKALQFAMRSRSVEDLPFEIRPLTDFEKDILIQYNAHDVSETCLFLKKCEHLIKLRQDILDTGMIEGDVLNFSDVKIGAEFLIKEIGKDKCYTKGKGPNQTHLAVVKLADVILPKIYFQDDKYDAVKEFFKSCTWYKDRENSISAEFVIDNFKYHFGMGGIHGSVETKSFHTNGDWQIIDLDVASLYPSIGIANDFYPNHLGSSFVDKYKSLKDKRFKHTKGTALNAMYKLALNGAFGNSNNPYSPFYDPSYLLKITINGQLQILQLAERLFTLPQVIPIQVNTDGITVYAHKSILPWIEMHKTAWQQETGLELEEVYYKSMYIRDVNNYIAITMSDKIKSKGAYWYPETEKDYDGVWNKDFSAMVVQKAIRLVLTQGINPEYAVRLMTDPFDFMLRYKTTHGATVYIGDIPVSKTIRYYISKTGKQMSKVAKPKGVLGTYKRKNSIDDSFYNKIVASLPINTWDERIHTKNKSMYEDVVTNIENGKLVKQCNLATDFDWKDVDYDYYIKEVEKLII